MAERPDRHRLQRQEDQGGRAASRSCSPAPTSRARSRCSREMRDTMGFMLKVVGADPSEFTDDEWADAIDRLSRPSSAGPDPAVHRQRLHPGPRGGQHRGLRGLVRRRHPAAVRQPRHQVRRARGGPVAVERQHAGAQHGATTRPTPRSGSTTTTSPRSRRSSPPGSTTSARSRARRQEMEKIDPSLVDNQLIFPTTRRSRRRLRLHAAGRPADRSTTKETSPMSSGG